MSRQKNGEQDESTDRALLAPRREFVENLFSLSGMETLNNILNRDKPDDIIREMNLVDLFWMIKKIGEEDSLPILRLANNEQWQYLVDMEIWQRDRIDIEKSFTWLERFFRADPDRLTNWLYGDGSLLAHFYFFRKKQGIL